MLHIYVYVNLLLRRSVIEGRLCPIRALSNLVIGANWLSRFSDCNLKNQTKKNQSVFKMVFLIKMNFLKVLRALKILRNYAVTKAL